MLHYLTASEVSIINTFQITQYSPQEQLGVRDFNALERTVNQPKQEVFSKELYPTIAEKAAILMINLVKKHPFHNANKRTALMAVDIFLQKNNVELQLGIKDGGELLVSIATFEKDDFEQLKMHVASEIEKNIKH